MYNNKYSNWKSQKHRESATEPTKQSWRHNCVSHKIQNDWLLRVFLPLLLYIQRTDRKLEEKCIGPFPTCPSIMRGKGSPLIYMFGVIHSYSTYTTTLHSLSRRFFCSGTQCDETRRVFLFHSQKGRCENNLLFFPNNNSNTTNYIQRRIWKASKQSSDHSSKCIRAAFFSCSRERRDGNGSWASRDREVSVEVRLGKFQESVISGACVAVTRLFFFWWTLLRAP